METAAKNYTGDKTQEAVLRDLIIPVAKEAGFSLTMEDVKLYESGMAKSIDLDEMDQIAGGGSSRGGGGVGIGGTFGCDKLGWGLGANMGAGSAGICIIAGYGDGPDGIVCVFLGICG